MKTDDTTAIRLAEEPRDLFGTAGEMFAVPYPEVARLQLEALQHRLRTVRVPATEALEVPEHVDALDEIVPFLFPTDIFKSYEFDWLSEGNFDELTEWLDRLSIHDLSSLDTRECRTIDGWLDLLEDRTPLLVCHSSGTSGKLSFVPRTEPEWRRRAHTMSFLTEAAGSDPGTAKEDLRGLPIISPFYRTGRSTYLMTLDWNVRVFGDPDRVVTLHEGRLSSDLMVLAGRMRSRDLTGGVGSVEIPATLEARMEDLEGLLKGASQGSMDEFVERARRFEGERVWVTGGWPNLCDAALAAEKAGITGCFAASSVVHTGGGAKGRELAGDEDGPRVRGWLGVEDVPQAYGMSEVMGAMPECSAGRYHMNPWQIPFVLDPATQAPLPRTGTQRGQLAMFDLLAESYWGGMISTDLIELSWDDAPCACGRLGPHLDTEIQRVQDVADDKISCAAQPAAADDALERLRSRGA